MKGNINNLQLNEDVKFELLNLFNSSSDEESDYKSERRF